MTTASGIISLQRADTQFKAGYGLLKQDLPGLLKQTGLLHPGEKEYLDHLKYDRRKHSYLLGRIACKQALSTIITQKPESVFVDSGIFQFPVVKYIREFNIQVGISHCNDIGLALAFPEAHPLGIDIEKVDSGSKTDAMESQMTAKEQSMAAGMPLPSNTAYTLLWTIKEGLSKILKTGLMTDFKFFEVNAITPNENSYESTFAHHGQYKAVSHLSGPYVCTIVLPKNTKAELQGFWTSLSRITGI